MGSADVLSSPSRAVGNDQWPLDCGRWSARGSLPGTGAFKANGWPAQGRSGIAALCELSDCRGWVPRVLPVTSGGQIHDPREEVIILGGGSTAIKT